MLAIEMSFPAGKYHATPWNRQVNEGAVEWPPSPWRILRALISTWHHKLQAEIDETAIRNITEKLSASPQYFLPQASLGHSRHYMPLYSNKTTMVIDTFAAIDSKSRLIIAWKDVDLSAKRDLQCRCCSIESDTWGEQSHGLRPELQKAFRIRSIAFP